jgi:hypothetical protein
MVIFTCNLVLQQSILVILTSLIPMALTLTLAPMEAQQENGEGGRALQRLGRFCGVMMIDKL